MAKTAAQIRARPLAGWIGRWLLRICIGFGIPVILVLGILLELYCFALLPQHKLEERQAEAFARLSGPARRLAIYDAFVDQIDRHYFDQSFSGFNWPKLRREWRAKAAAVPDDLHLYSDVLFQLEQRIPSSHVAAVSPPTSAAAPKAGPSKMEQLPDASCLLDGYGAQIVSIRRAKGTGFTVGEVRPDSPAARAGVTPGWAPESWGSSARPGVNHFDGVFIRLDPAQAHIFESGGSVKLGRSKLETASALKRLRRRIQFEYRCGPSVDNFETRRLPSGALYIRFDEFQSPVLKKVEVALKLANSRGVVLDLRFNHGGYAVDGLNLLLPPMTPLLYQRSSVWRRLLFTDLWSWHYRGPLVVLIGPASASAAEITAAVLKRSPRAVLVGRRTNGSVLGAKSFPLPDSGQVQIPVSDVEMLDGSRLEDSGVPPDIEVFPTAADLQANKDAALERAERELSVMTTHRH